MEQFLFDTDAQQAPIGTLSGGERRRLQLLLVLTRMPNVLLLDEPTNDLDLDTLRALEAHLEDWPGSLVVVSHDRALLERTVEDRLVLGAPAAKPAPIQPSKTGMSVRAESASSSGGGKARSPSTLRRLIGVAERELAEAERARDAVAAELAAGDAGDHEALASLARALAEAEARLGQAEERWLTLSEELGS
jgi:ATP-binding cassette subfamily F protein uup